MNYEDIIKMMETGKIPEKITGQLMFRESSASDYSTWDDENSELMNKVIKERKRKLVMVFGVIALPEEIDLRGEHQYVIQGSEGLDNNCVNITIYKHTAIDLTNHPRVRGGTPSSILQSSLWRV